MIKGSTLSTSIEKLKYLYGLQSPGFVYNSIEIKPFISNKEGKIIEYNVTFDITVSDETTISTIVFRLNKLNDFFLKLLFDYSLSEDGKVVYNGMEGIAYVSEGYVSKLDSNGWESFKTTLVFSVVFEN